MRQLDYNYPCNSTPAMGFHLVIVDNYSRGLGSSALHPVEELLVELGAARVVARGNRTYWQGISGEWGARVRGCTDCVQEGAGPEEVLRHVDDGVADGVEHLDGHVSPHGVQRGACT